MRTYLSFQSKKYTEVLISFDNLSSDMYLDKGVDGNFDGMGIGVEIKSLPPLVHLSSPTTAS